MAIEKLNSTNYLTWCSDIGQVLIEANAWDIVNGIELKPEPNEGEKLKDYEKRSVDALVTIYFNIEREFKNIIASCEKPQEAWQILKTYCSPENRVLHMKLLSELDACKMNKDESMVSYASRVKRIAEQIRCIGQPIPEFCVSFQLLKGLPKRFDSVKRKIMKWSDDRFVLSNIISELIHKDLGIKGRKSDNKTLEGGSDATKGTEISSEVSDSNGNSGALNEDVSESSEEVSSKDLMYDGKEESALSPRNGVVESDDMESQNDYTEEEADGVVDCSEMTTCCSKSGNKKSEKQIGIRVDVISDKEDSSDCIDKTSSSVSNKYIDGNVNIEENDYSGNNHTEEKDESKSGNIDSDSGDQECSVGEYKEKEPDNVNHCDKGKEIAKESSSGMKSTYDEESGTSGEPDSDTAIREKETFKVKPEKPTEHEDESSKISEAQVERVCKIKKSVEFTSCEDKEHRMKDSDFQGRSQSLDKRNCYDTSRSSASLSLGEPNGDDASGSSANISSCLNLDIRSEKVRKDRDVRMSKLVEVCYSKTKGKVQIDKLVCCRRLHDEKCIYYRNRSLFPNPCEDTVFQENRLRPYLRCFKFRRKKLRSSCTHDYSKSVFLLFSFRQIYITSRFPVIHLMCSLCKVLLRCVFRTKCGSCDRTVTFGCRHTIFVLSMHILYPLPSFPELEEHSVEL